MMKDQVQSNQAGANLRRQQVIIYAVSVLVAFLLGFIPMWLKYRDSSATLYETERQLSSAKTQNTLASAVIDARRGEYELARQAASDFFSSLTAEINKSDASAFSQEQRAAVQPLIARRDEIITLLARSDPASADRLSELYVSYREIITKPDQSKGQKP
jgi:hypothetical protein